mmetsp:Transcript_18157/g.57015  ORF Transcript_18157/g.57015 Transcript_18157/m.57015 type:complete len:259 (-) Transcript_18157:307-1083(-)
MKPRVLWTSLRTGGGRTEGGRSRRASSARRSARAAAVAGGSLAPRARGSTRSARRRSRSSAVRAASRSGRGRSKGRRPMHLQMRLQRCVAKKRARPRPPPFPTPKPTPSRVWICGSVKRSPTPWTSTTIRSPAVSQKVKWLNACGVARQGVSSSSTTPETKPKLSLCFRKSPATKASMRKHGSPARSGKRTRQASSMSTHLYFIGFGDRLSNFPAFSSARSLALYRLARALDSACVTTSSSSILRQLPLTDALYVFST